MKFILYPLFVLFMMSTGPDSLAEEFPDISKLTEEQINQLPKDVVDRVPARLLLKKFMRDENVVRQTLDITTAFALSKLLYFTKFESEEVEKAIKKFQRDLGKKQTGELTWGQFQELKKRHTRFGELPIYPSIPSDKLQVNNLDGFVSVKGTWIIENETIAHQVNFSTIECRRETQICTDIFIYADIPASDNSTEFIYLNMNQNFYKILSWSKEELIANRPGDCRNSTLKINFGSNQVWEITTNNNSQACKNQEWITKKVFNSGIIRLKKPRISTLLPASKTMEKYWADRQDKARSYINSDVKKYTDELINSLNSSMSKDNPNSSKLTK